MGRAFEYRKARMFKRWDAMSKAFTRFGKEISIAVRQGGGEPETNPRLRAVIQNAKGANMPKDKIEAAIKRASAKDEKDFQEVVYEGYGPHGIAIVVETAADNPTRTVSNVRLYFNRGGGTLGTTGSLDFLFDRKGVFRFSAEGQNRDDLELELIDHGADEITQEHDEIYVYTRFSDFGEMQKALEEKGIQVISAELQRIPHNTIDLTDEQAEDIIALIEKFEDDDDVQAVYHNMNMK
ncbi:MAG: YebC/PmpR family DNA-binding transcriptional regulator [Bacteroidota bacterium]|nr:YebC/PmpR family DNA-binding transcriptional regulator [Bacteroidota bacterium]